MARNPQRTVADAMVTHPAVHRTSATVGEVRAFLADEHMHMALLVSGGELVGTIERSDLPSSSTNELRRARSHASRGGRSGRRRSSPLRSRR
jgi:hypothetical protein